MDSGRGSGPGYYSTTTTISNNILNNKNYMFKVGDSDDHTTAPAAVAGPVFLTLPYYYSSTVTPAVLVRRVPVPRAAGPFELGSG